MYQSAYNTIEMSNGDEWACNREGEGVFSRRRDGTWQQHTGTGQTPTFRSPAQFRRWLTGRYIQTGEGVRVVGRFGWDRT